MKAYRFMNPSKGLEFTQVPVPVPEQDQILIEIKACGLCHTDCNVISGLDQTLFWERPITLGHEIAGVVVSTGSQVTKFKAGDRVVGVLTSKHPIAVGDVMTSAGFGCDGGFAQFTMFRESKTLAIPHGVTFAQAAVATDAGGTAYHAVVTVAEVSASSKVAIVGLGGLGLSAVQIAARFGARVYGIDIERSKFVPALQSGAFICGRSFDDFPGVNFDIVLDFAGIGTTTAAGTKAVRPGGKVVLVGLSKKEATIDTHLFVMRGVRLIGSVGCSIDEVAKTLQMIEDKEFTPIVEEIPFGKIIQGLQRLSRGEVIGRLYTDPSKDEATGA
ncbi:chaperonin 10-like protein [Fusarium oxysporum Fo47]|nr:chaperonin 10-like protein [Fusarium oxysporum Fo47]QKD57551.2 chaperonin 10-like protein [Fusarium oxysporum Fo47]